MNHLTGPPARLFCASAAFVLLSMLLGACSIEKPESPRFETSVYLPLGQQRTTGLDLYQDSEYIEGDSTGAGPLAFVLRGDLDEFRVEDALDVDSPGAEFHASLDAITIQLPSPVGVEFSASSLIGLPGFDPEGQVVAPFAFQDLPISAPPLENFEWIQLSSGSVRIRFQNNLDVSLGDSGQVALGVLLRDGADQREIQRAEVTNRIPPRGEAEVVFDLAGRSFHNQLEVELWGMSPGSGGELVQILPTDGIRVELALEAIEVDSVRAVVPGQSVRISRGLPLSDDIAFQSAAILDGGVDFAIESGFPLEVIATLRFPDLRRDGQPFPEQVIRVPAAIEHSQRGEARLDLRDVTFTAPTGETLTELRYELDLIGEPGPDPVSLGLRQKASGVFAPGRIRFQEITGALDQREVNVQRSETDFDPPEGIEELEFSQASLTLQVESTIALEASASVLVQAIGDGATDTVSIPLSIHMPAASPGGAASLGSVTVDETNSDILELLRARPQSLILSGDARMGGRGQSGTVQRSNHIGGSYVLTAPLRVRMGRIEHRTDPFHATMDPDEQERIREDMLSGGVSGQVENHFPVGLSARISFAATEEELESAPAVVLDSITVLPGVIDQDGRVTQSTLSPFEISLDPEQIRFFARDSFYGRVSLWVAGSDPDRLVMITARDYVEVRGMLQLRARVGS